MNDITIEAGRGVQLWDRLLQFAAAWAAPFGIDVRKSMLPPHHNAGRYCLDLLHPPRGESSQPAAVATIGWTIAELLAAWAAPEQTDGGPQILVGRLADGVSQLLDFYRHDVAGAAPRAAREVTHGPVGDGPDPGPIGRTRQCA